MGSKGADLFKMLLIEAYGHIEVCTWTVWRETCLEIGVSHMTTMTHADHLNRVPVNVLEVLHITQVFSANAEQRWNKWNAIVWDQGDYIHWVLWLTCQFLTCHLDIIVYNVDGLCCYLMKNYEEKWGLKTSYWEYIAYTFEVNSWHMLIVISVWGCSKTTINMWINRANSCSHCVNVNLRCLVYFSPYQ